MRDKETGTWWQQITGKALYGPLQGASLELVPSDEVSFGEWKSEASDGKVLAEVPKYIKEYDSNWEPEVAKLPVVISFPGTELKSRDVVVGLQIPGPGRAYPWETLVKQSPVMDHVQGMPVLVAVGPDGKSFRVFVARVDGKDTEFFLKAEPVSGPATTTADAKTPAAAGGTVVPAAAATPNPTPSQAPATPAASPIPVSSASVSPVPVKTWTLLDATTASEWNFQGCATSGPSQGKCLERVPALKDYWFDWRNYHPETTIYKR